MTTDKKSCDTCKGGICPDTVNGRENYCDTWKRDPLRWLSILPTEPGWYWWRWKTNGTIVGIINDPLSGKLVTSGERGIEIDNIRLNGQWQGPIKPDGDK